MESPFNEPTRFEPRARTGAGIKVGPNGRYELVGQLGRGGMGVVWRARDSVLELDVAIKFLPDEVAGDKQARRDLKREARNLLRLTHTNIVRVYDFFEDGETSGIAMELVEGETLLDKMAEKEANCFDVEEVKTWLRQLCDGLGYAHGKLVLHRDLKPANLMVDQDGTLKICDFGIARAMRDTYTRATGKSSTAGTLSYMSPQHLLGEKAAVTDDVYALGATLYELLTGRPPFYTGMIEAQIERKVPPSVAARREELGVEGAKAVPNHWEELIAACLAKEAEGRPQNVAVVWESVDEERTRRLHEERTRVERERKEKAERQRRAQEEEARREREARERAERGRKEREAREKAERQRRAQEEEARREREAREAALRAEEIRREAEERVRRERRRVGMLSAAMVVLLLGVILWAVNRGGQDVGRVVDSRPEVEAESGGSGGQEMDAERAAQEAAQREARQAQEAAQREARQAQEALERAAQEAAAAAEGLESADRILEALAAYRVIAARSDWPSAVREQARGKVDELGLVRGSVSIDDLPEDAVVKVGGEQRQVQNGVVGGLALGTHQVRLEREGYEAVGPHEIELAGRNAVDFGSVDWRALPREPAVATKDQPFENSLDMRFVPVRITGGPTDGQRVLFSVWPTRRQDYAAYARANAGVDRSWENATWDGQRVGHEDNHPVVMVSWEDARRFCEWLTEKERAEGKIGPQDEYRLPSDHEWSCAVGIGGQENAAASPRSKSRAIEGVFPWGTDWPPPRGAGNFADATAKRAFPNWSVIEGYDDGFATTSPVGSFTASADGLYDLSGNVWEWVEDAWEPGSGSRVLRGGSFGILVARGSLLSSYRGGLHPGTRSSLIGFRVVLVVGG